MSKSPKTTEAATGSNATPSPQDAAMMTIVEIVELALQFRKGKANLSTVARLCGRAGPMLQLDQQARSQAENAATIEVAKRLGMLS